MMQRLFYKEINQPQIQQLITAKQEDLSKNQITLKVHNSVTNNKTSTTQIASLRVAFIDTSIKITSTDLSKMKKKIILSEKLFINKEKKNNITTYKSTHETGLLDLQHHKQSNLQI